MKKQFLTISLVCAGLLIFSAAHASGISCMTNHEDLAAQQVTKLISQNITALLAKKGIKINAAASSFELSAGQEHWDGYGTYAFLNISEGTLITKDGTQLNVELKKQLFNEVVDAETIPYEPVLKSAGFDNEGNAVHAHCTLMPFEANVNITHRAQFITITNASTGRVIGRVGLPEKISLY